MEIRRIDIEELHKTPDKGMYITNTQKENFLLFAGFIALVGIGILRIKKLISILRH